MMNTAKNFVAKMTGADSLLCVKPSIDLTHDAMASSRKFPVAELYNSRTRERDNLIKFDAFDEISELPRGHKVYGMVLVDW